MAIAFKRYATDALYPGHEWVRNTTLAQIIFATWLCWIIRTGSSLALIDQISIVLTTIVEAVNRPNTLADIPSCYRTALTNIITVSKYLVNAYSRTICIAA